MVVDDSIVARTMLTRGLSSHPQIEVVGAGFSARDAKNKRSEEHTSELQSLYS